MGNLHIFDAVNLLLKRFFLIVLLFSVSRFLFLLFNLQFFLPFNFEEILRSFLFGIRFDIAVLFYLNFLFIFCSLLPFRFTQNKYYQKSLFIYFLAVNSILLMLNFIDTGYFEFSHKRSGWELLDMLFTGNDAVLLLPQYLKNYWFLALLWIAAIYALYRMYPRNELSGQKESGQSFLLQTTAGLVLLLIGFATARGIKSKPLRIISANRYVDPGQVPLLLNTPFVIINTIQQQEANGAGYFAPEVSTGIYTALHTPASVQSKFRPRNVVIIILESLGKEYMEARAGDGSSFTPFLDSLSQVGLNCTKAYANAFRSMDALPAIIGGFPSMLNTSFISSAYSVNKIRTLPEILKEEGYQTAFFHGGHNGTMGFDIFSASAGIEHYYGFKEYKGKKDHDGAWGIWDEKFLQFMANELNNFQEPFFATVFTLSSHDPYGLPDEYSNSFHPGEQPILRTIEYTDFALKEFFRTASSSPWFSNTLFVICPDHTSKPLSGPYRSLMGRVSIPLIYYAPGDSVLKGIYNKVTQQLDIMNTVLDYLGHSKSYVAFGKSIFEEGYRFSLSNDMNIYQGIDSAYCVTFDGEKVLTAIRFTDPANPLQGHVQTTDSAYNDLLTKIKAYLQEYYWRLNHNCMADTTLISNTIKD